MDLLGLCYQPHVKKRRIQIYGEWMCMDLVRTIGKLGGLGLYILGELLTI